MASTRPRRQKNLIFSYASVSGEEAVKKSQETPEI
jgi:hypothetical protein